MDENIEKQFITYLVGKKNLRPSSARTYCNKIKVFMKRYPNLDIVKHENIIDYMAKMKLEWYKSQNERRLMQTALIQFFGWYSSVAGIQNPVRELQPIHEYRKIPRLIHPEEIERLCYYAIKRGDDYGRRSAAIIALLADTGIRIAEFEMLKFGDIRLEKAGHFTLHVPAVKNTYSRPIPFGKLIDGNLVDYFARYYMNLLHIEQKANQPLFYQLEFRGTIQEDKNKSLKRGAINYIIKKLTYESGIDRAINIHAFRHFYATYSIINGMDIISLKEYLGHASIETTYRYVHLARTISGEALEHAPTKGIKSAQFVSGFASTLKEIIKHT